MKRLAIITTHPIQYYAPVFALLTQRNRIVIKVFYTWGEGAVNKQDPGFGKTVTWDLPLLDEYLYEWVENTAKDPGSHHFGGIVNPTLNQRIEHFQPDAILVFGWAYSSHLNAIRYFSGKTHVYFRGDSTLIDNSSLLRAALRYVLLRWVYHFIDHAFYVGANNKAYLKKYGLTEQQLSFAPHAVDNARFAIGRSDEVTTLRKQLGVTPNDILILFAGKFEEKKSPLLLLEAFIALKLPNLHLLFTGNGHLEERLKAAAKGMKNVHFLNFQNQSYMPVIYQACDLFCLPSQGPGESWGLAVNEAMACGKPALVSDKVGCAVDLVSDENGAVFPAGDRAALTEALTWLTSDKEHLKQCGQISSKIIARWNFANIAGAIENKMLNEPD